MLVLLAFGVSFELPLIAVALNLVGLLSYSALRRGRRWIFFLTIVFAALVTPTQDPFTMLLMALPMCVLFEIATDGPGFGVDEDPATLGEKVILPPRFEGRRAQILAGLKPID